MKIQAVRPLVIGAVLLCATYAPYAHAQFPPPPSYEPTFDIGFQWNGTTTLNGGIYDFPLNTPGGTTYIWPGFVPGKYTIGWISPGTLHNLSEGGGYVLGGSPSQQGAYSLSALGKYTVVIFYGTFHNIFNDPIHLYIDWFQHDTSTGTNIYPDARPPNEWGYLTFTVTSPPPTIAFTAASTTIINGATTTLSWTSTNATSCTASNGWSGPKATSSTAIISPATTTTYALTCSNVGRATTTAEVIVSIAPRAYAECCSSVAFIPGMQATELFEGSKKLWPPDLFDTEAPRLKMTTSGQTVNDIRVGSAMQDVSRGPFKFLEVYGEFFNYLSTLKSSGAIHDWKSLPYDWRYDAYDVVAQDQQLRDGSLLNLANQVRALAADSDTGKVTIVAHSNGGLVGKALVEALGPDATLIDRFVMVGSPQLGTPSAIAAMLNGHEQGLPKDYAQFIMSRSTARTLAENMPGAYGLLPLGQYSTIVSDPTVVFDNSALTASFRSAYGAEITTKAELVSFLLGIGDGRPKPAPEDVQMPNVLNAMLLNNTLNTRSAQELWTPPANTEVIQIVGWGLDTMRGIKYYQRCVGGCFLDAKPITTSEGDETVVWTSAAGMPVASSTYYLNLHDFNADNATNWSHVNLLAAASVQDLLRDIILKTTRSAPNITSTKPLPESEADRLHLSVHSPVTIGIRDAQGRFTGVAPNPDPTSDIPIIVREIPNSYYYEFGEGKYVGVDAGGQYEVIMHGTDNGTFALEVEQVHADAVTATSTYSNVPVSTTTTAELRIQDLEHKSALEVDEDSNGTVDMTVDPDGTAKVPLTVTAQNKVMVLGAVIPPLTYTLSGFEGGDTASSTVMGTALCTTTANATSSVGTYPITCTIGTLASGRYDFTTFTPAILTVLYRWDGFTQPINDTAHQIGQSLSVFKAGSTVPVKFQLKNALGTSTQAKVAPLWLPPQKGSSMSVAVDESFYSDPGTYGNTFKWDSTSQQYLYNWSTKGLSAGYWYRIYAQMDDGKTYSVVVGLR